jgi:hypothetical protein
MNRWDMLVNRVLDRISGNAAPKESEIKIMHDRGYSQAAAFPRPGDFLMQVGENFWKSDPQAHDTPIELKVLIARLTINLYGALPMFHFWGLPKRSLHSSDWEYENEMKSSEYYAREYYTQFIRITGNKEQTIRILVSTFTNALTAFRRALPPALRSNFENATIPREAGIKLTINISADQLMGPLQAYLNEFSRPEVKMLGLCRLYSTVDWKEPYRLPTIDFYNALPRDGEYWELNPNDREFFSNLPTTATMPSI